MQYYAQSTKDTFVLPCRSAPSFDFGSDSYSRSGPMQHLFMNMNMSMNITSYELSYELRETAKEGEGNVYEFGI